jgi:hypothetical protein
MNSKRVLWTCVLWLLLTPSALAAPTMPAVDGGTVWTGDEGVFQQWDDGAWVYVWRPAPGEPPPEARWPERTLGTQHELAFAGRRWSGGYLMGDDEAGDRVLVARDEGGRWYMALFVPGAVLDARADFVVQALREMSLEGE